MKNISYGVVIILLGVIITLTIITVTGTMNREIEIEDSLKQAVENSVEACTTRYGYSLDDNDQFVADLIAKLSNAIENDSDIKVDVMGVDKDKGYLSVRVTEYYKSVIGTPKSFMCETTAYLDKGGSDNMKNGITITFIDDDGSYLGEQTTERGEAVIAAITPQKSGKTFNGWLNTDTNNNVGTNLGIADNAVAFMATYK